MTKKKTKKKKNKLGSLIYYLVIVLACLSPIAYLYSKSTLAQVNYELEKTKKEISVQKKANESLTMKINELASLDKIQEVADSQGLRYNNKNIKTIE